MSHLQPINESVYMKVLFTLLSLSRLRHVVWGIKVQSMYIRYLKIVDT